MIKIIDNFREQDLKQQILFGVFVLVLLVTVYVLYSSFFKKTEIKVEIFEELEPLNLDLKVLESETFSNLKNN